MAAEHVYLVPGFFGFTNLGELTYFGHVVRFLADRSAGSGPALRVHAVKTPPTASLPTRAARLAEAIDATAGRGNGRIHLIGHSSGGLDVRLLLSPGVSLPTHVDIERLAGRVRTAVTVSTPHHGTPVASFFTGLRGRQLLELVSVATMYVLRFGHLPVTALLRLGALFARLDRHLGVNSALLDQLFGQLLGDFSLGRRRAIGRLLADVRRDQALLTQLTPEGMHVFNASVRTPGGVRCGSVVIGARAPGIGAVVAAGLDPAAQASHAVYRALYRLASRTRPADRPVLAAAQAEALRRGFGSMPTLAANDGLVPTRSQVWGDVIHVALADHLDVIGHFDAPSHAPPHYDWLSTGTGFDRARFEATWRDVARYLHGESAVAARPRARVSARSSG